MFILFLARAGEGRGSEPRASASGRSLTVAARIPTVAASPQNREAMSLTSARAHAFLNRSSMTAASCSALRARKLWASP